jgi:urease accessory protein
MNVNKSLIRRAGAAAVLMVAAGVAQAHEGHGAHGFAAGLAHPFAGADHLLAMLAVGVWSAAALPASRRLAAPALFLLALLGGALAGVQTGAGVLVEAGVALSVALFGVALLARSRLPLAAGFTLVALAGVLHGAAHGAGWVAGSSFASYAAGFMLGSAALHAAGLLAGSWLARVPAWVWRANAALIGGAGMFMLAARL